MNHASRVDRLGALRFCCLGLITIAGLGCHTFDPSQTLDPRIVGSHQHSPHSVVLVISPDYAGYESNDRGSPLADPQRWRIGAGLAPLTEKLFRHAFAEVSVVSEFTPSGTIVSGGFVITPSVSDFDHTLRFFSSDQEFEIWLSARIVTTDGTPVTTIDAYGSHKHRVGLMDDDADRMEDMLSRALQRALLALVNDAVGVLEERTTSPIE